MCRAMNRSFTNVLFGAFGKAQAATRRASRSLEAGDRDRRRPHLSTQADVVIIPATAWRSRRRSTACASCTTQLTKRGVDVKFAIHPVAGRMPGHMNVLLAEAKFRTSAGRDGRHQPEMPQTDVAWSSAPTTS
jgi:NAD(P) transhydrogenase subunit beta